MVGQTTKLRRSQMSEFYFVQDAMAKVDAVVATYISSTSQDIMTAFSSAATQLLVIYIMFWGWSMMRGVIQEPVMDAINRFVRLSIILGLSTSIGLYQSYIVDFLWNTPDALASVITGSPSNANNGEFLDTLFAQQYDFGSQFIDKAHTAGGLLPDVALIISGWVVWIFSILIIGYAGFLLILSKFALAILLAVGPIFVLMVVFEPTKRFFEQWLGQCVNFIFLVVLTAAATKMLFGIVEAYMTAINNMNGSGSDANYTQIFPLVFLCAVSILVLLQLPSIASSLGGGVSLSTMGFVNAALNKLSGGIAGRDTKSQSRKMMNNARWVKNKLKAPVKAGLIAAKRKFRGGSNSIRQA